MPSSIFFGAGARKELAPIAQGRRLLMVASVRGRKEFLEDGILGKLAQTGQCTWMTDVRPQPELANLQESIDKLAGERFDAVVAFGGGSAIDTAKALAACLAPTSSTCELSRLLEEPELCGGIEPLPLHALSTTSGTGAEVTPFATIWDSARKKKLSLAGPSLFPHSAFVDPELTYDLPWDITVSTGLDALNQAFESVWNKRASSMTLSLAAKSVCLGFGALLKLKESPENREARSMIAEASLLAGICISQTRTAICHAMSYPLSLWFGLPHGLACAFSMRAVADLCSKRQVGTFEALALATGHAGSKELAGAVYALFEGLEVNSFIKNKLPGVHELLALSNEMYTTSRSDNFVIPVSHEMLLDIVRQSYGELG